MVKTTYKSEVVQFRLTPDQLEMLNRAFQHYISAAEKPITRAAYIRTIVMLACLQEVDLVSMGVKVKADECNCPEVQQEHSCGRGR